MGTVVARGAAALAVLLLAGGPIAAQTPNLDACAERVRDRPEDLDSYLCYWLAARQGEWDGARRALEALLAIDPENHRARLYLAAVLSDRGHPDLEPMLREAADGFAAMGEPRGEVYALLTLCGVLSVAGHREDRLRELKRAERIAEATPEQPELRARVLNARASAEMKEERYGAALALLRQAEEAAFPDGPVDLQSRILSKFGYAYWAQGLGRQALDAYTREAEILNEVGSRFLEVGVRYNIALISTQLLETEEIGRAEHVPYVERALELAVEVGNRRIEAKTRLFLARAYEGDRAIDELRRAIEIGRELGEGRLVRESKQNLAHRMWLSDPANLDESLRLLEQVVEDARASGHIQGEAIGLQGVAGLLSESSGREDWIPAYREAIDAVEQIRDLQPDGTVGARLFWRWAGPYYRFAGLLLDGLQASPDPQGDLDLAFSTVERMRSRVLLDELDVAGAHPTYGGDHPMVGRREEVLTQIARVQKRLADPSLPAEDRAADLETLEQLELDEAALRAEIARVDPAFAAARAPDFPSLDEVRERLAPDQAILSYQLARRVSEARGAAFQGDSWVFRITKDGASAFRLPEKKVLEDRVAVFLGLCKRRDGSEAGAAAVLFEDLVGEALDGIDPSIRQLVIVLDGSLHHLPFAALRRTPGDVPLGVTHEIVRVPSVTLWLTRLGPRGRGGRAEAGGSVLALADPEIGGSVTTGSSRTSDPWSSGLRLGPLPLARTEASRLVRAVGGDSRMATGPDASERFLKEADLDRYRLLHLAAHAVVDHDHPDRSAVVLTPGSDDEDGFLQPREIVDLDLRDRVVIVSACQSASGTVLRGEGVLGLARAFFQAGARAVVGNLWPMRDDDAEILMTEVSRHLADGASVSSALAGARAARFEAGAPAAAWAGLVVLGDGEFVPFPGGTRTSRRVWLPILLGAVFLACLAAWALRRK